MSISVVSGDFTAIPVDSVVNAANSALAGGGGVDGVIHRAAGPELLAACRRLGGCSTGSAVITEAYRLPAKHVIHAVGPVWTGGEAGEDELLRSCYLEAIREGLESAESVDEVLLVAFAPDVEAALRSAVDA